jgi:hypothetical protein
MEEFQMSIIGGLTFFLGIQVKQMKQSTFIHHAKYTKDLMKKYNMVELKPMSTPMITTTSLDPDENGEPADQREYSSMIGSLPYLTVTQLDIQFAMCLCTCFHAFSCSSHRITVHRIFRYLKQTLEFGIWYSTSPSLDFVGFFGADFVGCGINRKRTSDTCHFLRSSLICWSSKKQSSVTQSTIEAEYVATAPKSYELCTP